MMFIVYRKIVGSDWNSIKKFTFFQISPFVNIFWWKVTIVRVSVKVLGLGLRLGLWLRVERLGLKLKLCVRVKIKIRVKG
jgi:hypothetical protein